MSFELILPFFPEELRALLLDPSISDLMINGTSGVYADRGGSIEKIALTTPYSNERLQAAIERVARILGQDLTSQNPVLNTRLAGRLPRRRRWRSLFDQRPDLHRSEIQSLVYLR